MKNEEIDLNITYERWLADEMILEYYLDELAGNGFISIHRLIFNQNYRDFLKQGEYLTKDTYSRIRDAQKVSYKKVYDSLLAYQIEEIKSQSTNTEFLNIRLKKLKQWYASIEESHPVLLENMFKEFDYSINICGHAFQVVDSSDISKKFRFEDIIKNQITELCEPIDDFEDHLKCNELNLFMNYAMTTDLIIQIQLNRHETRYIENILNGGNSFTGQIGTDKRSENKKDETLEPEEAFWKKAKKLYGEKRTYALTPNGNASELIVKELTNLNFNAYQRNDTSKLHPKKLSKSTVRRRLNDNPQKWQKIVTQ